MSNYDVIVIGVGAMGSATVYHLARRGLSVLGLEQFDVAHDRGSSHGQTRIMRKAYFEHPAYVPLLHKCYEMWSELEAATGARLFERCGLILFGPPDGAVISGVRRVAREHDLDIQSLSVAEAVDRFPGLRPSPDMAVMFEQDAGILYVEECVRTLVAQAITFGATIETGCKVLSWSTDHAGVVVDTDGARFTAAKLVICSGAWSARLLADVALPLEVRRKVILWFATDNPRHRLDRGCPVFGFECGNEFLYGFPVIDEYGLKVGNHTGGDVVSDPDAVDREIHAADVERPRRFVAEHLPGATDRVRRHSVCMYTMTPDEHFIVDAHPKCANVFFAAGFSGHGFKFAPIIGSVLADLVTIGRTDEPVGFLSLDRPGLATTGD